MRVGRKEGEWRMFGIAAFLSIAAFVVMLTGCASVQHDPLYDDASIAPSYYGDSVTYIKLTVENTRVHEPSGPQFYLDGSGRHPLGIIAGPAGKKIQFVDIRWLGPDGCAFVVARYVGEGEIRLPKFCWQPGQVVSASLNEIVSTSNAWAHR